MHRYKKKGPNYLDSSKFISRQELLDRIFSLWKAETRSEFLLLEKAAWRISAEALFSQNTLPVNRMAALDGIAVSFSDFENGPPDTSAWVEGRDFVPADFGDDFPDTFDTVIRVEDLLFTESTEEKLASMQAEDPSSHKDSCENSADFGLKIKNPEKTIKGQLIREAGSIIRKGEEIVSLFSLLTPYRLNVLRSSGLEGLSVLKAPLVGFIPTGSELISPGSKPKRGENIESNSLMAAAALKSWGAEIKKYPILKDDKKELEEVLLKAVEETDFVLMSGGSSMGTEDFSAELMKKHSSFFQHGVRCIPGQSMSAAIINGKPFINMPGPPFASFCTIDWCARALVSHYYRQPHSKRSTVRAKLVEDLYKPENMDFYFPMILREKSDGSLEALPFAKKSRTADKSRLWDALWVAPIGESQISAGRILELELMNSRR